MRTGEGYRILTCVLNPCSEPCLEYLRDAIPTSEAFIYPELGHISIFVEHDEEMFDWRTQ